MTDWFGVLLIALLVAVFAFSYGYVWGYSRGRDAPKTGRWPDDY